MKFSAREDTYFLHNGTLKDYATPHYFFLIPVCLKKVLDHCQVLSLGLSIGGTIAAGAKTQGVGSTPLVFINRDVRGESHRNLPSQLLLQECQLGPVVRKPINANPRLKVNRGFHLAR